MVKCIGPAEHLYANNAVISFLNLMFINQTDRLQNTLEFNAVRKEIAGEWFE